MDENTTKENQNTGKYHHLNRVALVLVVLGLLVFVLLRKDNTPAPEPNQLKLVDAVKKDDLFFARNATNPFTGLMIDDYKTGAIKSKTFISDGLLHGLSQAWHTNGQLQVTEYFDKGISDGLRTKWREDGSKLSEGTIVQGEFQGVFRKWHPNGQLSQEINMVDGKAHGVSRSWYESGALKSKVVMENGDVKEQEFFKDEDADQSKKESL